MASTGMASTGNPISAPGKMMLAGEYAITRGGVALVAAVGARVFGTLELQEPGDGLGPVFDSRPRLEHGSLENDGRSPEVLLTRELVEQNLGHCEGSLALNDRALRFRGVKLGLGSSAAKAACTAGLIWQQRMGTPIDDSVRESLFDYALAGHRAVAPRGSGADVAASCLGGVLEYSMAEQADTRPSFRRLNSTSLEHVRVVWVGKPAKTEDFVGSVEALEHRDGELHRQCFSDIRQAAEQMMSGLTETGTTELIEGIRHHQDAMEALGNAARVPIVEAGLARTSQLARRCGGGSKPSGAGGGDVAFAAFPDLESAEYFDGLVEAEPGLQTLDLAIGVEGIRQEPARTDTNDRTLYRTAS